MAESSKRKKILENLFLGLLFIILGVALPQSIGFYGTGFEDNFVLTQYVFYANIAFIVVIVTMTIANIVLITKHDNKYGDSLAFNSPGELPVRHNIRILKNPFSLFLLSVIFFLLLGTFLFTIAAQSSFTGVRLLDLEKQQFSPVDSFIFSTLLVPISENAQVLAIITFLLFSFSLIARKTGKISKQVYAAVFIIFLIISHTVLGLTNHNTRYANDETAKANVFLFWSACGIETALTQSFIPCWVMHMANNGFIDMIRIFGRDTVRIWGFGIAISLFILWALIFLRKGKKGRK